MTCGKRPEAASSHKAGEVRSLIPRLWVLGRNCLPFCLHCIERKGGAAGSPHSWPFYISIAGKRAALAVFSK